MKKQKKQKINEWMEEGRLKIEETKGKEETGSDIKWIDKRHSK